MTSRNNKVKIIVVKMIKKTCDFGLCGEPIGLGLFRPTQARARFGIIKTQASLLFAQLQF